MKGPLYAVLCILSCFAGSLGAQAHSGHVTKPAVLPAQVCPPSPTPLPNPSSPPSVSVISAPPAPSNSAIVAAVLSALAGIAGAYLVGHFATRNAKLAIVQKANELEITDIDRRINEFIAPYEQLSAENLKLSNELKRDKDADFRTLVALLDPRWKRRLSKGERVIVDSIVENGNCLRRMILQHGGAVPAVIRPHMAAASMHFRMLALADAGSLDQRADRYGAYVYPRQLDNVLALERERLERRRTVLRNQPGLAHLGIEDLKIPPELQL